MTRSRKRRIDTERQVATVAKSIERATKPESQQPRLANTSSNVFGSYLPWQNIAEIEPVPYSSDSRRRDAWLRTFWRLEPKLAGVVNAVTVIDSNRGWSIIGGRNQVRRYTDILHSVDGGAGWRMFARRASLSYWTTDMGAVVEVGRDGEEGPMRALYHVDSARCKLTGSRDLPLEYYPALAGMQRWGPLDYFRVASMPSDDETYNGLGFSAVSRCVEVVRLLYAVMLHDQERVAARAPQGLLLLDGVGPEQFEQALAARRERLDADGRKYYGGVLVLCGNGLSQISANLVALSQLPANFDAEKFTAMSMYALALCFGYDPSEFWPVQFGALGRGTETEVQHTKATGKGGMDFILNLQEQMQLELPPTLQFEFESRDDQGELAAEMVKQAKVKTVTDMYGAGIMQGSPLISREEGRILLAEQGIIDPEWTVAEEDVEATDTDDSDTDTNGETANPTPDVGAPEVPAETPRQRKQRVERWMELDRVQRAIETFPRDPVIRYAWDGRRGISEVLWSPHYVPILRHVERADKSKVLYKSGDVTITEDDVNLAIKEAKSQVGAELAQMLEAPAYEEKREWDESAHPRDESGKFGMGGGSDSSVDSTNKLSGLLDAAAKAKDEFGEFGWGEIGGSESGEIKDDIASELSGQTGSDYQVVSDVLAAWANTSNDNNHQSLSLQEDAAVEFGGELSEFQRARIDELEAQGHNERIASPNEQRKILRAMYDNTQAKLAAAGIGEDDVVELHRGFVLDDPISGADKGTDISLGGNMLESWSVGQGVARQFASDTARRERHAYAVSSRVKRKDIFSTSVSGMGCVREGEIVIFGNKPKVSRVTYYNQTAKGLFASLTAKGAKGSAK